MAREPHFRTTPDGKRWTLLDCQLGNHTGLFAITRTPRGWGCDKCLERLPAPDPR